MKARLGFTLVLILVAVAAATTADLFDGVENEETSTAVTTASEPHFHMRGSSGGIFDEKGVMQEQEQDCTGITLDLEPDLGERCQNDSDCRTFYPCGWSLVCDKYDGIGVCANAYCGFEGVYCDKFNYCCGAETCSASHLCVKNLLNCHREGDYCFDGCCTHLGLICGKHNRCQKKNPGCRRKGYTCSLYDFNLHCCSGLICGKTNRCITDIDTIDCVRPGKVCAKTSECCGNLHCRSNRCIVSQH